MINRRSGRSGVMNDDDDRRRDDDDDDDRVSRRAKATTGKKSLLRRRFLDALLPFAIGYVVSSAIDRRRRFHDRGFARGSGASAGRRESEKSLLRPSEVAAEPRGGGGASLDDDDDDAVPREGKKATSSLPSISETIFSLSAEGLNLSPARISKALTHHWWELPCRGDVDALLPALRAAYKYRSNNVDPARENGILIDVGANVGQTSSAILSTFGDVDLRHYAKNRENKEGVGSCGLGGTGKPPVVLFALEPGKAVGDKLERRARERGWLEGGQFHLLRMAAGDADGTAKFADGGDERSGLLASGAKKDKPNDGGGLVDVTVRKLDTLRSTHFSKHSDQIFLLKTDCEGHDPAALRGASTILSQQKAKFLLFEYNKFWFDVDPQNSLKSVQRTLFGYGYVCFFVTPKHLLPISDVHWNDSYEIKMWSNVFCGLTNDEDLSFVLRTFHDMPESSGRGRRRSRGGGYDKVDEYFFHCEGKACVVDK